MVTPNELRVIQVPIRLIDEPQKVDRLKINADLIQELARSIEEIGLLQPVLLREHDGRYEIIAGHRRYLAHVFLQRTTIDSLIKSGSAVEISLMRATENLRRENLTPLEEGLIYKDLLEVGGIDSHQIGKRLGVSAGLVRRRVNLCHMPANLRDAVQNQQISVGVAEELWRIHDDGGIDYYLGYAVDHGCTVTVARGWVKEWKDEVRRTSREHSPDAITSNPFEEKPVYVGCDLCSGPMQLGTEKTIRCCPECVKQLRSVSVARKD